MTAPRSGGASGHPQPAARARATRAGSTGPVPIAPVSTGPIPTASADRADATSDIQGEYVRALIRSQLRLALVCAIGFVGATVAFVVAVAWLPTLDEASVAGVPVSWLLLAFGVYPLVITVAAIHVRSAARNEARYRSLAEDA